MASGQRVNVDRVIQIEGLTKAYGDLLAVEQISLEVQEGELFGFLGPNGAGKTTTIRMLTGLSKPTAGTARVLGFDIRSQVAQAKRHIGVVPEQSNLYDELSARDNLLFMGKLYGVPRQERTRRAEELLHMFRLYERKDDPFRALSRGMKRALTIAAALVHKPKLLLLDEPTVGLDVAAARSLRALIAGLHDQGVTVFLTTHYLEEADLLCDRIAILVSGKVVRTGTPTELKRAAKETVIEGRFKKPVPEARDVFTSRLPGASAVAMNSHELRILGGDPAQVYRAVFAFSEEKGVAIEAVNTIKPSLEDAFIQITGLSSVAMAQEKGK